MQGIATARSDESRALRDSNGVATGTAGDKDSHTQGRGACDGQGRGKDPIRAAEDYDQYEELLDRGAAMAGKPSWQVEDDVTDRRLGLGD